MAPYKPVLSTISSSQSEDVRSALVEATLGANENIEVEDFQDVPQSHGKRNNPYVSNSVVYYSVSWIILFILHYF